MVADPDIDVAPRQTPHEVVLDSLEALFLGLIRQVKVSINLEGHNTKTARKNRLEHDVKDTMRRSHAFISSHEQFLKEVCLGPVLGLAPIDNLSDVTFLPPLDVRKAPANLAPQPPLALSSSTTAHVEAKRAQALCQT